MTLKTQKIISTILVSTQVILSLQALIYILNLNQINIFLHLSLWVWILLAVLMAFWYDLHFKNPGSLARAKKRHENVTHWLGRTLKIWFTAFWDRIEHFRRWKYFKHWQNYLLLPGMTFWATVTLFYLNFGQFKPQQIFALFSSAALIVTYWYLKEIFHRRKDAVDEDIFIALSVIKIYTIVILYSAGMGLMRYFCLSPMLFTLLIFSLTFLLVYQALFQNSLIKPVNLAWTLLIAAVVSAAGYFVYVYWGYNYYTAGILLAAFYNLLWTSFHYYLDHSLTKRAFWEILAISLLIAFMILQVTNFKARILGACM